MPVKTTLILGAGSSCSYGYVTGRELRRRIVALGGDPRGFAEIAGVPYPEAHTFFPAFKFSATRSIDFFLARNTKFADVGKAAIARVLLECENASTLMDDSIADNWYSYLVNTIAHQEWGKFDPSWLTVVTFNYDRSLETFLLVALKNLYDKTEAEVIERLAKIRILHVYGDLCEPWVSPFGLFYGAANTDRALMARAISHAVSRLLVVAEGRDNDEILTPVREAIRDSQRIAFLGFGFDETNVRRLGMFQSHPEAWAAEICVATTKGLKEAERARVLKWLYGDVKRQYPFLDVQCEELLRETLILE